MELSLFNIHYNRQLSQETNAFTAILCVGGTPFARVRNDGRGGCNYYDPLAPGSGPSLEQLRALKDNCQAQLECEHDPMASIEPLDQICGRLLEESLMQKSMVAAAKRAPRRNAILFRTDDDRKKPGAYSEIKFKTPVADALMREYVRSKHPDAVFLADLEGDPTIEIPYRSEVL